MKSPFAASARQLAEHGYQAIPISAESKAPAEFSNGRWYPMKNWQRFRTEAPSNYQIDIWSSWPDCNVGVLTGTPAGAGYILGCVDFDSDDFDVLRDLQGCLPLSPVTKKGKRGYSAFYRVPVGTKGFRTPQVELLTDTRQTVVPPSIHPDTGRPYTWGGASLCDVAAVDLPVLGEDDLEKFRDTVGDIQEPSPVAPRAAVALVIDSDASIWRRINTAAYSNLEAWVPQLGIPNLQRTSYGFKGVAHWRGSTRGRPIAQRNANLSIMLGQGAKDFGTGNSYTALNLVAAALSISDAEAFEWLGGRLGMLETDLSSIKVSAVLPLHDAETGEVIELPQASVVPDEFPDHLTRIPGILGDVVNWIEASARRPIRSLALGSAVTLLGTLMGGAVAGPTESATHLFVVGLAPSGAGKEHPLRCQIRLLDACNKHGLVGPSEFQSMSAVVKLLINNPTSLCSIDELGAFLARLSHPKASTHEMAISKILRSIWGISFDAYNSPAWASMAAVRVNNPALSIFGASVPDEFFAALSGNDVVNGFLNRWLLLSTSKKPLDVEPVASPREVPASLALALVEFYTRGHAITPADMAAPIGSNRAIKRMAWNGGRPVYQALLDSIEIIKEDADRSPFYARTAEMAVRLATIRAMGMGQMVVDAETMEWGAAVARWSADRMSVLAMDYIAENETQRLHNRVKRIISARGGRCSHRDMLRALQGGVKSQDLKGVVDNLLASGELLAHKTIPTAGGTPTITYELQRAA